ncbi:dysbindin-like isoform X1 [Corythoichthys intestinalis]|uniref:dysbindin-like isoform X1 n=1 Tax=Corythoichthys intestinalis TaxID=161448 RepID=UPI0025A66ABA|nr:dysbindin-like isoform X1 [Corythoichthys intestinalis]
MSTSSSGAADGSQRNSLEAELRPAGEDGGRPKPKDRNKPAEDAFQQDVEHYLTTGYLHIAERRGPTGSMSSMEVNVDLLEQMDLMDMSDHEALDVFLHSGGEDNSAASPVAGPESLSSEISLQVPTQAELRHKLSSLSSACARDEDEEEEDDEEEGSGRTTRRRRRKRAPPPSSAPDV